MSSVSHTQLTPLRFLERSAEVYPDKVAIVHGERRTTYRDLLEAKRFLAQRLPQILPAEVACNELLMNFLRQLVAPDPTRRFPSAEAADMFNEGAAAFHRQLIVGGLASEYENEIRLWLEDLE